MGELRNCPNCGKVFVFLKRNLCPACIEEEEEKFDQVRVYLKKNPGATVEEVAEEFDIEEKVVLRWLREGRIEVAEMGRVLTCKKCGVPITFGNLCTKCAQALTAQMLGDSGPGKDEPEQKKPAEDQEEEKPKRRMYVIERFKD